MKYLTHIVSLLNSQCIRGTNPAEITITVDSTLITIDDTTITIDNI